MQVVHVLELTLYAIIVPVDVLEESRSAVRRLRSGPLYIRRRYGCGLGELGLLRHAIDQRHAIPVPIPDPTPRPVAVKMCRGMAVQAIAWCWGEFSDDKLALASLWRLSGLIVAQMADITLDTARTWPLQIAGHMRSSTVYTRMIDLAPLFLAITAAVGGAVRDDAAASIIGLALR